MGKINPEFGLFKSEFGHLQYGIVTSQDDVDNFLTIIHMDVADSLTRGKDKCLGLLVHECWHVCERIFALMGEKNPSSEFTAYTLQAVFQGIVAELRQRGFKV